MKLYEELREVEYDIRMLENELQRPWSLADEAFLEQELEKLYNYRHELNLKLNQYGKEEIS
jgi:hypothetical protein